jgi:hypothetical protein
MNVLDALNIAMQSEESETHYLDYWPNFQDCRGTAVEQQSNSTLAVAANMQRHLAQI